MLTTSLLFSPLFLLISGGSTEGKIPAGKGRIVGGEDAGYGNFPYVVELIHRPIVGQKKHLCGGTIVDKVRSQTKLSLV